MSEIKILDATCGSRSIWFQKNEPHTVYCDRRECTEELPYRLDRPNMQHLEVHPDIIADFKDLPFGDGEFNLVVFDPPHAVGLSESWIAKKYGTYPTREEMLSEVTEGFRECWRVLATGGGADIQVGRNQFYGIRDNQSDRTYSAIRTQKRKEKRNTLDVLHEV